MASKTITSNTDLIPIYTQWANRHLAKINQKPISNIAQEFQDYRIVASIVKAIVPQNESATTFQRNLLIVKSNIEGLNLCLQYLRSLGVNCSKVTSTDLEAGSLGAVLQLLFALSTYKQQAKERRRDEKLEKPPARSREGDVGFREASAIVLKPSTMPPSVAVSKLPSLHQPRTLPSIGGATATASSKLMAPSRIALPKNIPTTREAPPSPAPPVKTSSLRPPSSTTGLRSPSRGSGNNNGSVTSTTSSTIRGSLSSIDTTSAKSLQKPSGIARRAPDTDTIPTRSIAKPKASLLGPTEIKSAVTPVTKESKMLKLKLFGGNKDKKEKTPQASPAVIKKTVVSNTLTTSRLPSVTKPSLEVKTSKLATPTKRQPVQLRTKQPAIIVPSSTNSSTENLKRTSKSSEEDSAYAGFGSTSPASSTQSSISLRSASTKDSREMVCETSPTPPPQPEIMKVSERKAHESQDKPTLAVKALNVNIPPSSFSNSRLVKPTSMLPLAKEKAEVSAVPKNSPEEEKSVEGGGSSSASTLPPSPTVGVVSPMQHRKNIAGSTSTNANTTKPQIEEKSEKQKPPPPVRTCKLESSCDNEIAQVKVPAMAPVRQPPSYSQLLNEGRIQKSNSRMDSSTSEDSLDSITTTVRVQIPPSGYRSEGNTMNRRPGPSSASDVGGYTSESGIAIYEKMQDRLRECRESMARGGLYDYGDSLEDSSSLSSGISDNFDDISTDDLSGPDHPMATATFGKPSDYQPFSRSVHTRGPRSSSTSIEHRSRRVAEQENLHQLLQQCRTSQRGAAAGVTNPLRSPGYNTIGFARHIDSDTLSVHSRASVSSASARGPTASSLSSGFHSLDRKTHMSELYENSRMWTDRNAMAALVSPRRMPAHSKQQQDDRVSSAANASLHLSSAMSRSMVMLDVSSSSPTVSRRRTSPHTPRTGRIPLSVAASPITNGSISSRSAREGIYSTYRDPIQLHRLNDEISRSPSHMSKDPMGSHLSLASSTAYSNINERYEAEIRKMNSELDGYRQTVHKLTRKHDDYTHLMEVFDQRLSYLARHVEKAQLKPEELARLRQEIENLRDMSNRVAQTADAKRTLEGAGELLRQPSLESVASMASHRSSMSSSSKSSKTDKMSLNSFGAKTKKSWIRSSFTKAFSKKKKGSECDQLNTINGSTSRLDEIEVVELKKQLEDRDEALTDVRLDALDKAREVDVLRETVNRLKNENKQLKQDMSRLLSTRSRASSQVSLAMNDEEPLYEIPPTASSTASQSSKRSSGCNSVKVTVNVDMRGVISSAICPDNEIIIGFLPIPAKYSTWSELDQQIYSLFDTYIGKIDPDRLLGLHCSDSLIGYQIGSVIREKDCSIPESAPADVITPTTTIRLFMRGAAQQSLDSLVLECLFPRSMLEQLLQFLLTHRRLVLSGATGIGKSNLARQLAAYLSVRIGLPQDGVQDIKIPDEVNGKDIIEVEQQLEKLLRGDSNVVVLMDNIPRHRIAFVSSVFSTAELGVSDGPYVICTVNRACQLPEMQVHHNFKLFLLTNRMDGVKGFMARFLRRRIIEAEFRLSRQTPQELLRVIQFLPIVLQAVNNFIEKANSLDVTVGPRIFLQCPLGIEESRQWFVCLWNENIVPYMVRVAREGVKFLGRCGSFEDPTDVACEHWPWLEGPTGEEVLSRLSIKDIGQGAKQPFNPLDTLIRLQASRNSAIENI